MKFGKKIKYNDTVIKQFFAILPVTINGETRWLENVKIRGYYWKGTSGTIYWEKTSFED